MILVTGTAPRCGTSAMMRELIKTCKPHSIIEPHPTWTAKDMNPLGHWEISDEHLHSSLPIEKEEHTVIKLWANLFHRLNPADIDLVVHMQRKDFTEQVMSIVKTAEAQGLPTLTRKQISNFFINQHQCLEKYFSETPQITVVMEDFREDPEFFIAQIKEVVPWAQ